MATITPVTFNTGSTISGTTQIGQLAAGTSPQDYSTQPGGLRWWASPNEDDGYIIAHVNTEANQPNPISVPNVRVGFWKCDKTEEAFIQRVEYISLADGTPETFTDGTQAKEWLNNNGYWTSYTATTPSSLRVLFLGDTLVSNIASNISNYITSTGQSITYSAVTMGTTYTGNGNITTENYDVVVIYTNASQSGSATLSTALTNYVNAGGNVVSGVFLWNLYAPGYNHSGTTAFNLTNSQSNVPSPAAFTVSTPSVITNGIGTSFGELVLTNSNPTLSTGASLYASYNSGSVRLLAVKEVGSSKLVSINTSFTNINTSGETLTKLVGNSILFAGGRIS